MIDFKRKVISFLIIILRHTFLIPILGRLAWADKNTKASIQKSGVDVIWSHFYSNNPSIEDIENSYEYTSEEPPYINRDIFNDNKLREVLDRLLSFSSEFNPPIDGNEENCQGFFWNNTQYSYCDAMSYYCFIRTAQPKNIIEIGSGFSTLVAIEAVEKNRSGQIYCVEPYPRNFIKNEKRIHLYATKAQEITPQFLNDTLEDGDFLFIDSTHTVKTGSDCLHIYLRLLPKINRKIFIHVHDVYLPFGMPKEWLLTRQIFWTEQYLLMAFLLDNPKASLLYSSVYNSKWHTSMMQSLMGDKYPIGGGSIWFSYNGKQSEPSS